MPGPTRSTSATGPARTTSRHLGDRVRDDPGVDAVLVLCTPPVPEDLDHLAGTIARVANGSRVPFVATYLGMEPNARVDGLRTVPAFEFPEAGVHALGRIARYGEWLAR